MKLAFRGQFSFGRDLGLNVAVSVSSGQKNPAKAGF